MVAEGQVLLHGYQDWLGSGMNSLFLRPKRSFFVYPIVFKVILNSAEPSLHPSLQRDNAF